MKLIYSQIKYLFCLVLVLGFGQSVFAQCPVGETEVTITYTENSFGNENAWVLWDATAGAVVNTSPDGCFLTTQDPGGAGAQDIETACVVDGNVIELYTYESFGDTWNGGTLGVTGSEDGSVNGCDAFTGVLVATAQPSSNGNGAITTCGDPTANGGDLFASFTTQCLMCSTCPMDITVENDPGVCGATLDIQYPEITDSPDCVLETIPACATIAGAQVALLANGGGTADTPFSVTGVSQVSTNLPCVTEVCLTFTALGDFDLATEESDVLDENGNLFTTIRGPQCTQFDTEVCIPVSDYNLLAADGSLDFTLIGNTAVNPTLCGGDFISVSVEQCTGCVAFVNSVTNDDSATGEFEVGTTEVVIDYVVSGVPSQCVYSVTVLDTEAPTFN